MGGRRRARPSSNGSVPGGVHEIRTPLATYSPPSPVALRTDIGAVSGPMPPQIRVEIAASQEARSYRSGRVPIRLPKRCLLRNATKCLIVICRPAPHAGAHG